VVHVRNGKVRSPILNKRQVSRISAYLVEGELDNSPTRLAVNASKAFQGSIVLGMGFTFDDVAAAKGAAESLGTMRTLIAKNERNAERIFPYIGGEEVNNSPTHAHHRYVIDFADFPLRRDGTLPPWLASGKPERQAWLHNGIVPADYPESVAADWPDLSEVIERRIKGKRASHSTAPWWLFERRRGELYTSIALLDRVLVTNCGAAPHLAIALINSKSVFAHSLDIFAYSELAPFAALQSRVHEIWARFFSSTLEDRLRYAPSDCFETFPFAALFESSPALEAVGHTYYDHRAAVMVARDQGMTKTYNRFHDHTETADDIQRLRELHAAMDRAVLQAYGWHDLAERAKPIFLDETTEDDHTYQGRLFWPSEFRHEVLARLLALNAERYAEEVRLGIARRMKGKHEDDTEDELEAE
jgi:hypothetical protein